MCRSTLCFLVLVGMAQTGSGPLLAQEPTALQRSDFQSLAAWQVYDDAARKLLSKDRGHYTYKRFSSYTFFPRANALRQDQAAWQSYFKEVVPSREVVGPLLNLSKTSAQLGDVVLMERTGLKPLVLVYVGEQRFPDREQACSFFIYPYNSGLEMNTMPPRWNRRLLKKLFLIEDDGILGLESATFKQAKYPPGVTVNWLQKPKVVGSVLVRTGWMKSGTTYRVLRAGSLSLFALEKPFPYHKQVRGTSCVFAAYVNLASYYGKRPEDKSMTQWEQDLIDREVDHPAEGSAAEKVAELVKQRDEDKEEFLDHVESWLRFGYRTRWTSKDGFAMKPLLGDPSETQFRELLARHLDKDEPVVATLQKWKDKHWVTKAAETQTYGFLKNYTRVEMPVGEKEGMGHAVVITGLRYDDAAGEWLVYFVCSRRASTPTAHGHWVTTLKEFHAALLARKGYSYDVDDPKNKDKRKRRSQWWTLDR